MRQRMDGSDAVAADADVGDGDAEWKTRMKLRPMHACAAVAPLRSLKVTLTLPCDVRLRGKSVNCGFSHRGRITRDAFRVAQIS